MRFFYQLLMLVFILMNTAFTHAHQDAMHQLTVTLIEIKAIKTTEKQGDELYFDLTVAKSKEPTSFLRIPEPPMHWPSQNINQLKNITLWRGELKNFQEATFLLSLNEEDVAPILVDDLIGSIHISVKSENGMLMSEWLIPGKNQKIKVQP